MSLRALSCQKEKKEEGADKRYREVLDIKHCQRHNGPEG